MSDPDGDRGREPDSGLEHERTLREWLAYQTEGLGWTGWLLRVWGVLAAILTAIALLSALTAEGGPRAGSVLGALLLGPFVLAPALMLVAAGVASIYGALRALFQPGRVSPGFAMLMGTLGSLVLGAAILFVLTETSNGGGLVRQEVVQAFPGAYSRQWTASGGGGSGGEICVALPLGAALVLCVASTLLAARRLLRRRQPRP